MVSIDDIKSMWIDTFGDSRNYVDMIIDKYRDPSLSKTVVENDILIASANSVVYDFMYVCNPMILSGNAELLINNRGESPANDEVDIYGITEGLKACYLCGLSTMKEYRGQGMMKRLISEIESQSASYNFIFSFLIPADNHLREYYEKLGYKNSCERTVISLTIGNEYIKKSHAKVEKSLYIIDDNNVNNNIENIRNISYKLHKDELREYASFKLNNIYRNPEHLPLCNIVHSADCWQDILTDFISDKARILIFNNVCESTDSDTETQAISILTEDNKFYPVYGDCISQMRVLFLLSESTNYMIPDAFDIFIFHPLQAKEFLRIFENISDRNPEFKYYVKTEQYAMVKILNPLSREIIDRNEKFYRQLNPRSVIINFMFD